MGGVGEQTDKFHSSYDFHSFLAFYFANGETRLSAEQVWKPAVQKLPALCARYLRTGYKTVNFVRDVAQGIRFYHRGRDFEERAGRETCVSGNGGF
jgi:hypothetical protein